MVKKLISFRFDEKNINLLKQKASKKNKSMTSYIEWKIFGEKKKKKW